MSDLLPTPKTLDESILRVIQENFRRLADRIGAGSSSSSGGSVPTGCILMWSGAIVDIPTGWLLCDGTLGTPDLRNRFIVGAGSTYVPGATGGADTVALTAAEMPVHSHTANHTHSDSGHSHTVSGSVSGTTSSDTHSHTDQISGAVTVTDDGFNQTSVGDFSSSALTSSDSHSHTFSGSFSVSSFTGYANISTASFSTSNSGSGSAHENRPPYYALAYIMKS